MSDEASESKQWFPLESNPDVMNKVRHALCLGWACTPARSDTATLLLAAVH